MKGVRFECSGTGTDATVVSDFVSRFRANSQQVGYVRQKCSGASAGCSRRLGNIQGIPRFTNFFSKTAPSKVESIMHAMEFRLARRLLSRREKVRLTMAVASPEGES